MGRQPVEGPDPHLGLLPIAMLVRVIVVCLVQRVWLERDGRIERAQGVLDQRKLRPRHGGPGNVSAGNPARKPHRHDWRSIAPGRSGRD
jgi:hypothetical protein